MAVGRCMIVDDEPDMRMLIRVTLEEANDGIEVECEAATGEEAIAAIDVCNPSVVVLDQMMPGLTGLETARRIRGRRPEQRFVLFTAFLTPELVDEAGHDGIEVCLGKTDLDRLPDAVRAAAA